MEAVAEAVRVYASVAAARERLTLRRYPRSERRWRDTIAEVRRELGDDAFEKRWAEGRAFGIDEAIALARSRIERSAAEPAAA